MRIGDVRPRMSWWWVAALVLVVLPVLPTFASEEKPAEVRMVDPGLFRDVPLRMEFFSVAPGDVDAVREALKVDVVKPEPGVKGRQQFTARVTEKNRPLIEAKLHALYDGKINCLMFLGANRVPVSTTYVVYLTAKGAAGADDRIMVTSTTDNSDDSIILDIDLVRSVAEPVAEFLNPRVHAEESVIVLCEPAAPGKDVQAVIVSRPKVEKEAAK